MSTNQELIAEAKRWDLCGSCDAGLPMDCTCPPGDPRSMIQKLVDALEQAESRLRAVEKLADEWRYKGEFGWGLWQEGNGPDPESWALDNASARIRQALALADSEASSAEAGLSDPAVGIDLAEGNQ